MRAGGISRRASRACAVTLVALLAAPGAMAGPGVAPEFGPHQEYAVGADPTGVAIADVTGDGLPDVLVSAGGRIFDVNPNEFSLLIFPQQVDGTLGVPTRLPTHDAPGSHDPVGIDVGDISGDGKADVAMGTNAGVDVFVQGPAGLLPPVLIPTPDMVTQVEIADVEGDNAVDLLVATLTQVIYFKHLHGAVFVPVIVAEEGQDEIELGDVTGGDYMDVVTASGPLVRVFRSHLRTIAPGTKETYFEPVQEYQAAGAEDPIGGIALGDVNGDGLIDVAASINTGALTSQVLVLAQKNLTEVPEGTRTLEPAVAYPSAEFPSATEAMDLDGDGRAEVVTLHADALGVYRSGPGGALLPECLVPLPYSTYVAKSLALGDVNNDGSPDAAIAADEDGLVVVPQRTGPPLPTALSLSLDGGPASPAVGDAVTLAGTLDLQGGCPTAGQEVSLFRTEPDGARFEVASAVTEADGSFSVADVPAAGGAFSYDAAWAGSGSREGAASGAVEVMVRQLPSSLSLTAGLPILDAGGSTTLSAHLEAPGAKDRVLRIYQTPSGGSRSLLTAAPADPAGDLSVPVTPERTTTYEATWAGDARYLPPAPAMASITVRPPVPAPVPEKLPASVSGKLRGGYRTTSGVRLVHAGRRVSSVATVAPNHAGEHVLVTVQARRGGRWVAVRSRTVEIGPGGSAVDRLPSLRLGLYRVSAEFPEHADHLGAASGWSRYRITP